MEELAAAVITLTLYLLVGTIIALLSRRVGIKTTSDYYVAGHRLGGILAAISYAATTYSAFMMVGLVGLTYATGVGAFGFEITYLLSTMFLLSYVAPKVWKLAKERNWVSPAEMISDLYGLKPLSLIVAAMYLLALIPYASAQLIAVGRMVEGMAPGLYWLGILLGVVAALIWTGLSGMWSLASTDLYQGLWMILAAIGFVVWLFLWGGSDIASGTARMAEKGLLGMKWSPLVFVSYSIPWAFFAVTNPQVVQKLYTPKDERALRRLITLFTLFGLSYTVIVTVIGIASRALTEVGRLPVIKVGDQVTPSLLGYAPLPLAVFVFTSIVAAAITTMDAIVLALSSTASRDVYQHYLGGEDRTAVNLGRISILALLLVLSYVAYLKIGFIVDLSVLASALLLPLAPVTLIGWFYGRRSRVMGYAAAASLASGFLIGLYWALLHGARKSLITPIFGLPPTLFILLVSTLIMMIPLLRR